jgi:hypothetical protein
MKKSFIVAALALMGAGLVAQSVRLEAFAPFAYDWSGYAGYTADSVGADLSSVGAGGGADFLMMRPSKGRFSWGAGFGLSYEYMTDFAPEALGSLTDHAIFIFGLQCRAEFSVFPWLSLFALAELDGADVSVFSALHPYYGTEDLAGGAQAEMGFTIMPFRWKVGRTALAIALSPRATARGFLLANVALWSFGAGMDLGLRCSL